MNCAEKQIPTKLDQVPEIETISEISSCKLTIDEGETFTEEICSRPTEKATVTEQETGNANKTSTTIKNAKK